VTLVSAIFKPGWICMKALPVEERVKKNVQKCSFRARLRLNLQKSTAGLDMSENMVPGPLNLHESTAG
jgi:hypothetical protein